MEKDFFCGAGVQKLLEAMGVKQEDHKVPGSQARCLAQGNGRPPLEELEACGALKGRLATKTPTAHQID